MHVIVGGNDHYTIIVAQTARGKLDKEMKTDGRILLATVNTDLEKWVLIEIISPKKTQNGREPNLIKLNMNPPKENKSELNLCWGI